MLKRLFIFALPLLLTIGCSSMEEDPTAGMSASEIYAEAKEALDDAEYETALDLYSKLEARYPYGRYAQQAQLETIYAHYRNDEPDAAVGAADRFIKLHPRHPNVDYAYYMRGLASAEPPATIITRLFPRNPAERSPQAAHEAFRYFRELISRYPNSRYSPDAHQRMLELRDNLAQYEVNVAGYYLRRGAYLAAANRGKYVLEHYPGTASEPEGLAIMVEAYRAMGLDELAADSLRVLKLNYPQHEALERLSQQPLAENNNS